MRAVVVALGKVGLPLAVKVAQAGHRVVGCDIDPAVVELVNQAREPFPGERGLAQALAEVVGDGRLRAGDDTTAAVAEGADLVMAIPPLLLDPDGQPDFRALDSVVDAVGRGLQAGTVVSVETTLPVGTTRERIGPRLAAASGLRSEQDFFTVHSPERVYSGRVLADLDSYPKLVGGLSDEGERRAAELYRSFLNADVWTMGSAEAAELTKLAETTYRDVNIALANEFARYGDRLGVDVRKVIDAANSQPFSHIHSPGVAVGGHCIPVYPRFYLAGDPDARIPAAAREVNLAMPAYAVARLAASLDGSLEGQRVLILGVSYRGGVKEAAYSGAFGLQQELRARGANVIASDPLYTADELRELGFEPWDGRPVAAAVLQADHREYHELDPGGLPGVQVILDGRGFLDAARWSSAGVTICGIGSPPPAPSAHAAHPATRSLAGPS
jgi:UDP-N-acetyl-D-mannosaminuronic acid dehydrogenase